MFVLTPGCVPAGGAATLPGSPAAGSGQVSMYTVLCVQHSVVFVIFLEFRVSGHPPMYFISVVACI